MNTFIDTFFFCHFSRIAFLVSNFRSLSSAETIFHTETAKVSIFLLVLELPPRPSCLVHFASLTTAPGPINKCFRTPSMASCLVYFAMTACRGLPQHQVQ